MIDYRSDTVTQPDSAMLKAMSKAPLGDDVYGEDPTVNKLEETLAERAGHESALFAPSGTQTNLIALMAHCERGDEYIVGQNAHTYKYEAGGAAVLGSIQPQPIDFEADGTLHLDKVKAAIKADDFHFAKTKLLALENTLAGKVIPQDYIRQARTLAIDNQLMLHLDGARVFNAAVSQDLELHEITGQFNSASICLSKGLGAPVGSVLCGNKAFINKARRIRKMLGGGMRQAGVLAAAGLFALENNVENLRIDHKHAQILADGLGGLDSVKVSHNSAQTNMVFISIPAEKPTDFCEFMKSKNILLSCLGNSIRMVTHRDISPEDIAYTIRHFNSYFG